MFKKFVATLTIALMVSTPVLAQERTFVTNPPTTSGPGITFNSGTNTVTATSADGARIYSTTRPIERAAKYKYEFTISGYSSGGVQPYVGTTRDTYVAPVLNATVPASSSLTNPGLTPIADNFTTADGLTTGTIQTPYDPAANIADPVGAFRFFCATSHFANDDPLVVPNWQGASHLHNFFGNTGTNAYSTHKSLRTSGGSSCGGDQAHPINRSAYWFPAMLNGKGGLVTAAGINVYYKRYPLNRQECLPGEARVGICTTMPNGLNMIWGYNMTTMAAGQNVTWECRARPGQQSIDGGPAGTDARGPSYPGNIRFANLQLLRNAGACPQSAAIVVMTAAPDCWNGTQLDTADHRAHMSYRVSGKCPGTHPYLISTISHQVYFDVNPDLPTWRLSSDDQMGMGVVAGQTFHTDFMEGWSPAYKAQWHQSCIDEYRSCSTGETGTGVRIKGDRSQERSRVVQSGRLGLGAIRRKNGTFTGEFTAPADGEFGLNFLLFTGEVTGFKVTKISKGGRGPVTTTTTQ